MAYQVWAFTAAGAKAAYLHNAYNISRTVKMNETPQLSFSMPADDDKVSFLTSAYDVKVWNTIKDRWEGLYYLRDATEKWGSDGKYVDVFYQGAMIQLAEEENISYDTTATPKTPTQIVTALLALQEHTPAVTVGTIQPTTSFAFAIENANLLAALLKCVEYLGGYMEVDSSRALNWYNEPSGNPAREIRYKKNMKGVTRKTDFTTIRNKIYAYGDGETEAQVTLIDAGETYEYIENVPSQTAYGVRIKRITDKRIIHPSTLLLWAQRYLATYKDPVYYYTVDVVNLAEHPDFDFDFEELTVGQIVRIVNSDLNNLNVNVKVVAVETNLSTPEEIRIELANATKDLSDSFSSVNSFKNLSENMAVQIGAGQVTVKGVFTVNGWRTAGQTTINGGQITANTIDCVSLKTSAIGATVAISSTNYIANVSGFKISGNGNAEFNSVKIRGTLYASTLETGNILTVKGTIQSNGYDGLHGWKMESTGAVKFLDNIETYYTYFLDANIPGTKGWVYTPDGIKLWWVDKNGTVTQLAP